MALTTLVEAELEKGRELVKALDAEGLSPRAAFWRYVPDSSEWRLFLVLPRIGHEGPRWAYRRVVDTLRRRRLEDDLPLRRISIVSATDETAAIVRGTVRTSRRAVEGDSGPLIDTYVYRST